MNSERLKELIDGYTAGTATPLEAAELTAWYKSFESLPSIADVSTPEKLDAVSNKMFAAINKAIDDDISVPKEETPDNCYTTMDKRMYQ